jgi:subtilisin
MELGTMGGARQGRARSAISMSGAIIVLLLTLLSGAGVAGARPVAAGAAGLAAQGASRDVIVVLKPDVADPGAVARELGRAFGLTVKQTYRYALKGFSASVPEQAIDGLRRNPRVALVDPDYPVSADVQTIPTGVDRIDADRNPTASIDGVNNPVNADVAILDSGISPHPDLNIVGGKDCTSTGSYADDNGHGTHVAGTVGAIDDSSGVVGVAPGVRLWAVKVLRADGSGSWSTIICGIDYVTANANVIHVANMSLGGSGSDGSCSSEALHQAICNSVNAGVTYAVAAGNNFANASTKVPAAYDQVITVSALADFDGQPGRNSGASLTCGDGSTSGDDTFACFSNFGADVDIAAPGAAILSTANTGGTTTMSGTSMATPHVAGAAALYTAAKGPSAPSTVKAAIRSVRDQVHIPGDPDGINEGVLDVANLTTAPVTPPLGELIPIVGGTQSANSNSFRLAADGDSSTSWHTTTSNPPKSGFVTFDLGQVASVQNIRWQFNRKGFADTFTIAASADGTAYTTLATEHNAPVGEFQLLTTTTSARYIRFRFTNPHDDARLGYLSEVEIYGNTVGTGMSTASTDTSTPSAASTDGTPTADAVTPTAAEPATATAEPTAQAEATAPATEESAAPAAATATGVISGTNGSGARCRAEPTTDAVILGVLAEGATVKLTGPETDGWYPVRCDGQDGFVRSTLVDTGGAPDTSTDVPAADTTTPAADVAAPTPDAGPRPYRIEGARRSPDTAPAKTLLDGDRSTVWSTTAEPAPTRAAITLDLGEIKPVGKIRWLPVVEGAADGLRVQVSEDGMAWQTVVQPGATDVGGWKVTTADIAARYVRFLFISTDEGQPLGGLAEAEIYPSSGPVAAVVVDAAPAEPTATTALESTAPAAASAPEALPTSEPEVPVATQPAPADGPAETTVIPEGGIGPEQETPVP